MNFEEIRPYRDEEVREVIQRLIKSETFLKSLQKLIPNLTIEVIEEYFEGVNTIYDFQKNVVRKVAQLILDHTTSGFSYQGLENLDKHKAYVFISNHRDIVLDSGLINAALHDNGFTTSEIAIGDNLLKVDWVKDIVRLNKSFIVQRNLPVAEVLEVSKQLSAYIYDTVVKRNTSVWIAQKEGRAKDGNDFTQAALLKMLGLSAEENWLEHYAELCIVPVAISYEYDPCDVAKVPELQAKMKGEEYVKAPNEDNQSMLNGIVGQKGKIHIHFSKPITKADLKELNQSNKNAFVKDLTALIDSKILKNYHLFDSNKYAFDLLEDNDVSNYSDEVKKAFEKRLTQLSADEKTILLSMYANPLRNKRVQESLAD